MHPMVATAKNLVRSASVSDSPQRWRHRAGSRRFRWRRQGLIGGRSRRLRPFPSGAGEAWRASNYAAELVNPGLTNNQVGAANSAALARHVTLLNDVPQVGTELGGQARGSASRCSTCHSIFWKVLDDPLSWNRQVSELRCHWLTVHGACEGRNESLALSASEGSGTLEREHEKGQMS
jgi:hypothetical protein